VRDQVEYAGSVPHRDDVDTKASTDSDVFREAVAEATRDGFGFDFDRTVAPILAGVASDPACRHQQSVASARAGSDGAALLSIATFGPSRTTIIEEGGLGRSAGTPRRVRHEASAGQASANARRRGSLPRDDRAGRVERGSTPDGCGVRRRGWDRQSERRRNERELRKRSVAFCRYARGRGWSPEETADVLGLSLRTLWHWGHGWQTDRLAPHPRGRPPRIAPVERQAEVTGFLELHGPSISLASLEAEHPDVARAELAGLRAEYRAEWHQEHAQERCRLEWLCPGSVWAMDFTHPPYLIDGVFPAILNVRDLASRHQLLWLAVAHEDAATVREALADLFAEHGRPLVMKCDNGPAFRAQLTKRFLLGREIFTLYSPPYCAQYNGGCERANRTLKELTAHVADQAGRRDFWKSDDLIVARLRANRLARPWGPTGPTPEETWAARDVLSLDKRKNMWQHLRSEIATVLDQRLIDPTAALSHYPQAEIERIAAQPVLEQLGLLHVTRRRITPVF
jgi:Integrase core domain